MRQNVPQSTLPELLWHIQTWLQWGIYLTAVQKGDLNNPLPVHRFIRGALKNLFRFLVHFNFSTQTNQRILKSQEYSYRRSIIFLTVWLNMLKKKSQYWRKEMNISISLVMLPKSPKIWEHRNSLSIDESKVSSLCPSQPCCHWWL